MEGETVNALPNSLLDAIWDAAGDDEAEADRLAERWRQVVPAMEATAERIRDQVRALRCRCHLEPESLGADGRCGRCYGRRTAKVEQ